MLRSTVSKVMWVGRATVFVVGLAVILAVVFGMASAAFGANGDNFILGSLNNTASAITRLTGNVNGPALQVVNNNSGTTDTALDLDVQPGEAPMKVNSATKVAKLNADRLDNLDSTRFVQGGADINGNSNANFSSIVEHSEGFSFLNTGFHTVVAHAPKGPPVDVLLSCPSQTSNGTLRIVNNTNDFGDLQRVWVDSGSTNPSFDTLGQDDHIDKTVQFSGDHFTIGVSSVFNANRMATMELFTEEFGPSVCGAKAHVIYTFAS